MFLNPLTYKLNAFEARYNFVSSFCAFFLMHFIHLLLLRSSCDQYDSNSMKRTISLPPPVTDTPLYILESSLQTQRLWYETAGKRPKQPESERQYFEKLWKSNFENSNVSCANKLEQKADSGIATSPYKRRTNSNENIAELMYVVCLRCLSCSRGNNHRCFSNFTCFIICT